MSASKDRTVVRDEPCAVRERPRAGCGLGRGQERVQITQASTAPPRRRHARRRARIGWLNPGIGHAGFLKRLGEQAVHVRALVQRDLFALQMGERFNRAILRDEDGLASWGGGLVGHVNEGRAGRLRKNRRVSPVLPNRWRRLQGFQKLRACRKLGPGDFIAERFRLLL